MPCIARHGLHRHTRRVSNEQEWVGRHYQTGEGLRVVARDGVVTAVERATARDDQWLAPAIFDPQVNGYAGVDFQKDGVTTVDLRKAADSLRADGCPRWLLTLITDDYDRLLTRLVHLKQLRDADPALGQAIAGWHVEGPFLSQALGYRGAHDGEVMRDPTLTDIERLRETVGADPLLFTIAPERKGAVDAIERASKLDVRVSLGHCDPSAEQLAAAQVAGAMGFTHLGNGCPQQLDRHDNIIWRVADHGEFRVGIIPDGIHVSPVLFRLLHRMLKRDRIYYTTDCMSAAGAPPGRYSVGSQEFDVGEDQVVRMPGQANFAGSALRPVQGVQRAAEMLGTDWRELWDGFATRPAAMMGLGNEIAIGESAHLCEIRTDSEGKLVAVTLPG